ncbi:uncharacterized protein LOC131854663 [Achroia grisella]|uniref:uncharacterized protein LOC131854663 n=1 Tax=Achroia grisella TaxID=688607 RepID=UPI0027D2D8E5|nr:uncharacterized protein LOC131854663 [Achroia grisella]
MVGPNSLIVEHHVPSSFFLPLCKIPTQIEMRVSTLTCAIYLFILATCIQVKAEKSHLGVDSDINKDASDSKEITNIHQHSKLKFDNTSLILENLSADISAFGNSTTLLYELHEIEPFIDRFKNLTDILLQSDEKVLQPLIMMLKQLTNILRTSFIPKYEKGTTFRDNIAFLIASDPILGLRVHNTSGEGFMNSSFEYLYQIPSAESDYYSINNSDAVVLIQSSVQGFIVLRQDYNITNSTIENGLINSIILFVFRDIIYTSVQSTTHNCLNLEMAQSARESGWRWDGRCSSSKMSTSGRWLCNCINLIYPYECKLHDTVPRDCISAMWWRSVQGDPVKRLTAGRPQVVGFPDPGIT